MIIKIQKKSKAHPRFISDAVQAIRGAIGESCNSDDCAFSSSKHKATIKDGILLLEPADNPGLSDAHLAQNNEEKNVAAGNHAFNNDKAKSLDDNKDLSKIAEKSIYKPTQTSTSKDVKHESDGFVEVSKFDDDTKRTFDSKLKIVDISYTIVDKTDKLTKGEDANHEKVADNAAEKPDDLSKHKDDKEDGDKKNLEDDIKDQFLDTGNSGFSIG